MLRRSFIAFSLFASPALAQTADRELPSGRELIAVYVGASTCGPCLLPEMKAAVVRMKTLLDSTAKRNGYAFSAVGVSSDWSTEKGIAFLTDNGPFDQLVIGGNWTNLGVEHFIWNDSTAIPEMPQIVVLERTVTLGARISISPARVLRRVSGLKDIPQWVNDGAPVSLTSPPSTANSPTSTPTSAPDSAKPQSPPMPPRATTRP
jgi:hypothetical protein